MKLVHNLQNLALKHQNSITDLLRNAYTIAFKLNLPDFKQWILYELNGYDTIQNLPKCRKVNVKMAAYIPIAKARDFTPLFDKKYSAVRKIKKFSFSIAAACRTKKNRC